MFTIFGIVWWLAALDLLFVLGILTAVANENPLAALVVTIVAVASLIFFGGVNPLTFFVENGRVIGIGFTAYLLLGFGWGVLMWLAYIHSEATQIKIQEAEQQFSKSGLPGTFEESSYYPFSFRKDFSRISNWIIWWPFSAFWTLTHDFTINVTKWIGRSFSGFFAWMARGAVRKAIGTK